MLKVILKCFFLSSTHHSIPDIKLRADRLHRFHVEATNTVGTIDLCEKYRMEAYYHRERVLDAAWIELCDCSEAEILR